MPPIAAHGRIDRRHTPPRWRWPPTAKFSFELNADSSQSELSSL
jgi:hypothetical protein